MAQFTVQPDELKAAGDELGEIAERLKGEKDKRDSYADGIGDDQLHGDMTHFINEWDDGYDRITKKCEELSKILSGSGLTYKTFDEDLARSFSDAASGESTTVEHHGSAR